MPQHSSNSLWLCAAACSAVCATAYLSSSWPLPALLCYLQPFLGRLKPSRDDQDQDTDVPDEFKDPISYEVMSDPVVLCATGQVYDYHSLRQWFAAGNYRCPKTNLDVLDAQVTRLPWLKHNILDWMRRRSRQLPPEHHPQPSLADIEAMHPQIAACIRGMRGDSVGGQRPAAVASLVRLLRQWQDSTAAEDAAAQQQQAAVRAAVMDDMLWMVRYGDDYLQGVAASVLACCCLDDELNWLAATAIVPLVAMLYSSSTYAQEWALQLLYKICLRVSSARPLLWRAGAVQGLLHLLSQNQAAVGFHRDRAAVALATLSEDEAVREWLREHGVVALIKLLLHSSDRWEQRDAAFALMALQLEPQDLQLAATAVLAHAAGPNGTDQADSCYDSAAAGSSSSSRSEGQRPAAAAAGACTMKLLRQGLCKLDHVLLSKYRWCSQRWLDGQVAEPDAGLTEQERSARQQYEAAFVRYRQARELRQQQADLLHQPEWAAAAAAAAMQDDNLQHQQNEDGHQRGQEEVVMLQQQLGQGGQLQLQLDEDQQQQQQLQGQRQNGHRPGAAGADADGGHRQQLQHQLDPQQQQQDPQQQQRARRHHGQQQPRHWMDEDGDSGGADDTSLGGASSTGSESDDSDSGLSDDSSGRGSLELTVSPYGP